MNNAEFFEALKLLEKEKGIPGEYLLEKIRAAIIIAVKRDFGGKENIVVVMEPSTGEFNVSLHKTVVDEVLDPDEEMLPEEARKYSKSAKDGRRGGDSAGNQAVRPHRRPDRPSTSSARGSGRRRWASSGRNFSAAIRNWSAPWSPGWIPAPAPPRWKSARRRRCFPKANSWGMRCSTKGTELRYTWWTSGTATRAPRP